MPDCNKPVGRGVVQFPCNLPANHDGPCVASEKPESARARMRWQEGKMAGEPLKVPQTSPMETGENHDALSEPTKQRQGDQPLPIINDEVSIQDRLIEEIERRKAIGMERYGTLLQPHNGRDSLRDAFEEALDLAHYLLQAIVERDTPVAHNPSV